MIYCLRGDIVPEMMMMMMMTTTTMMTITMMTMMMLTDCPLGDIVLEKVAEAVEHFPPPRNNFSFEKWKTFLLHRKMKKGKNSEECQIDNKENNRWKNKKMI